ncbi:ABC transporter permease [Nocardioides terrisoli]|uniref:ABC transporter permease n=1 Tax=Nocardioides terrisoli TaxID=3388267 RepID=UPI00287B68AE|nr:ABC transporter permease subunit [Nocardioides marmorisolisilvae]
MTVAPAVARPPTTREEQPHVAEPTRRPVWLLLLGIVVVWGIGYALFRGRDTLATPFVQLTGVQHWINGIRDDIQTAGQTNWFFHGVIGSVSDFANWVITQLQNLLSHPAPGLPVPQIGWLGVSAIFAWCAYAAAGLRSMVLVLVATQLFGVFGYWQDSIDMVIITILAVVVSMLIGIPTGIAMARRAWVSTVITPVLDAMQTMPSFAYIPFFFILFGPGAACAIVLTIVYSVPPLVRITEHGIRSVEASTQEAASSLGATRRQLLRKVQLPMARRTIVLGINQCTLAALSMAVIAGFINGPGLGSDVLQGLTNINVGQGAVPGLLIVVIAIALDRTTTAASERSERRGRQKEGAARVRRIALVVGAVVTLVAIYFSHTYLQAAQFPSSLDVGAHLVNGINSVSDSIVNALGGVSNAFKNVISYGFLNPLQELLADSPWWLMAPVLLAVSWVIGGIKPLLTTLVCEGVIFGTGLWNDTMVTLTTTVVATVLVMILAVVIGVWIGRSQRVDAAVRPILDGFQTIPSFVYLVPALALFSPSRFTAIVAATAYAAPISIKLVADGIRGVSATTVEAARASGITSWQMILKVQLPMARSSLALAANQGLLYVLSMVVIGGMVGAGSLGYLVVSGFVQVPLFGKGLAAGIAITALGILLDRTARAAAARSRR